MASSPVVSIAERLKQRREELGISQSQAARELDVARTAYRLWEMEAARPAPDRWRLIASWLGVSVTTMLLAEELVSEDEAEMAEVTALAFGRSGRDWDAAAAAKPGDFFEQARALIADGTESGDLTTEQAEAFAFLIQRIEQERTEMETNAWEEVELRRSYPATDLAPRAAREALAAVVVDLPDDQIAIGRLLISELVSNSVKYGSSEADCEARPLRRGRAQPTPGRGVGCIAGQCGTPAGRRRRGLRTPPCRLAVEPVGLEPRPRSQRDVVRARPAAAR